MHPFPALCSGWVSTEPLKLRACPILLPQPECVCEMMCLGSPLGVGTNFRKPGFSQAGQSKAPCCGKSVRMLEHHLHVAGGRFQFRLKPWGFCSDTCLKGSVGGLLLARSGSVHQSNSRARELRDVCWGCWCHPQPSPAVTPTITADCPEQGRCSGWFITLKQPSFPPNAAICLLLIIFLMAVWSQLQFC